MHRCTRFSEHKPQITRKSFTQANQFLRLKGVKGAKTHLFSLIGVCVVHCQWEVILQVFQGVQWVRLGFLLKPAPTNTQISNSFLVCEAATSKHNR